jgi:uncharacterized phiE125 gp8 family phage protein
MHKVSVVTAATTYPVTLPEVKLHLNISSSTKDSYIDTLISAATTNIERYLNRALITQTWKVFYDCFHNEMKIPFGALQSVTHVKYYSQSATLTTWATSQYWVVSQTDPGYVRKAYDVSFPELQNGRPNAIEIQFVCGYGLAASVPEDIKHAIKLLVTDYYENRGTVVIGTVSKIPSYLTDLIHTYRLYNF